MPYDFTDNDVYSLVKRTHVPIEEAASDVVVKAADGQTVVPVTLFLVCDMDKQPWPCDAIKQLREFESQRARNNEAARQKMLSESGAEIHRRRIAEGKISG